MLKLPYPLSLADAVSRWVSLPVYRLVVSFVRDNLRSEVIRRATQRPRLVRNPLCKSKIRDFEVAVSVKQQILGLKIAVDDVFRVQVFEG